jgi:hypothetical protein
MKPTFLSRCRDTARNTKAVSFLVAAGVAAFILLKPEPAHAEDKPIPRPPQIQGDGKPDFVDPGPRQVGGDLGDVFEVSVDGKSYKILINPWFVGDDAAGKPNHLYPDNVVLKLDTDRDGVTTAKELTAGEQDECGYCRKIAAKFLSDHPDGVQALLLDEAIQTIASQRELKDVDGNIVPAKKPNDGSKK